MLNLDKANLIVLKSTFSLFIILESGYRVVCGLDAVRANDVGVLERCVLIWVR